MSTRDELNKMYAPLVKKMQELTAALKGFGEKEVSGAFFNNHFHKDENGGYAADVFPIPVISVKDLCDIEIDLEGISITTKLSKKNALVFDYFQLPEIDFEIYGVEDYLKDYYVKGDNLNQSLEMLEESGEKEFFYSFGFAFDAEIDTVCELIRSFRNSGFYY